MELRKLQSTDMFKMFNILSKIGIKEIKDTMNFDSVEDLSKIDPTKLGIDAIISCADVILRNLSKAENEIYGFLSDLSGKKVNDLRKMDMIPFTEMIIEVIQKDEFKDFFKVASRLFK